MRDLPSTSVRLIRCPKCGYDISGLPARHQCPECGFAYDQSMFLLEGWRLHLYPTWWRLFGPPVVKARLECLQSEAEESRDEIQHRIDAAHRAEADAGSGL